ncbi:hypothetical protein N9L19_00495 [bacterium]|nr:hypothetical protein [bacterium]
MHRDDVVEPSAVDPMTTQYGSRMADLQSRKISCTLMMATRSCCSLSRSWHEAIL